MAFNVREISNFIFRTNENTLLAGKLNRERLLRHSLNVDEVFPNTIPIVKVKHGSKWHHAECERCDYKEVKLAEALNVVDFHDYAFAECCRGIIASADMSDARVLQFVILVAEALAGSLTAAEFNYQYGGRYSAARILEVRENEERQRVWSYNSNRLRALGKLVLLDAATSGSLFRSLRHEIEEGLKVDNPSSGDALRVPLDPETKAACFRGAMVICKHQMTAESRSGYGYRRHSDPRVAELLSEGLLSRWGVLLGNARANYRIEEPITRLWGSYLDTIEEQLASGDDSEDRAIAKATSLMGLPTEAKHGFAAALERGFSRKDENYLSIMPTFAELPPLPDESLEEWMDRGWEIKGNLLLKDTLRHWESLVKPSLLNTSPVIIDLGVYGGNLVDGLMGLLGKAEIAWSILGSGRCLFLGRLDHVHDLISANEVRVDLNGVVMLPDEIYDLNFMARQALLETTAGLVVQDNQSLSLEQAFKASWKLKQLGM